MTFDWLIHYFQGIEAVVVRIALALVLGAVFGLERELTGHEAGFRTNILIAISACLFTYLGLEAFPLIGNARDPARVAAQIVSGVGFLGAGTLLQTRDKVRGLTTAATIWLVAAVGMAAGAGAYFSAIFTTILALGVLSLLAPISRRLEARARRQSKKEQALREIQKITEEETDGEQE